ncbi:MAG: Omp28 family outer membrane lipoprotein [Bacteroides sp.]|nr:Omp28 family outer membrane lipoprotein [Ruminococcus flavefaciens]MCM1555162.1 Omp28 family outer membrane lipoprotein [Bacteroides sp.]
MKTIKYISGFVLAGVLTAFVACDTIKDGERLVDQGVIKITSKRCVLLEDYTGVRCVNCPNAAAETKVLQANYGSNLVVVALHPKENGLTAPYGTDEDLRTEEARVYAEYYQIADLPKGMVNRKSGVLDDYRTWGGAVLNVLEDTTSDYVDLTASAKLSGTSIQVDISGSFKADYPEDGEINVIAMVVEDNIQVRQNTSDGINKEYIHNHVLRTVISSDVWGDKVLNAHPAQGDTFSKPYNTTLNEAWKTQDLALVITVVNASTKEVLQAAYAHLQ